MYGHAVRPERVIANWGHLTCKRAKRCHFVTVGVALPFPVDHLYHYQVPPGQEAAAQIGCLVRVPLKQRSVVGVITERGDPPKGKYTLRPITAILDKTPSVSAPVLALTRWIANFYVCAWGEVLRAALPSEQRGQQRPMKQRYLRPTPAFSAPAALKDVIMQLRGPKQKALVRTCLHHLQVGQRMPRRALLLAQAEASAATARRLVAKGILEESEEEVLRMPDYGAMPPGRSRPPTFNAAQAQAREQLEAAIRAEAYATFLLHGVTGSGKTEVYLAALGATLAQGKTAIVLVPEISLTPQTVQRFRARFGDQIAVLHSRMSFGERYDAWRLLRSGRCSVAIGPRSAILAPMSNLGLIVVDEEHDSSYKQHDPAPRYHARDVAVMRAKMDGAVCILGSATPSLESLHNVHTGKYGLLTMKERVPVPGLEAAPLPDIQLIDLRAERRSGRRQSALSKSLRQAIALRLERKEQVILLQNRRGYSPIWECQRCGWLPACTDCSVTLTYHWARETLRCHYCGYSTRLPPACPECGADDFAQLGAGTQRVQEELKRFFPDARVLRMDLDTTHRKDAHYAILSEFGQGHADILVGTQMVAKGLDFGGVTLVGVVSADVGMGLPDFRAEERAAQLLMQVSGRAGRHALRGEVMLQTRRPDHPIFDHVREHDYSGFAQTLLEARDQLFYPPFGRLVNIEVRGPDEGRTAKIAKQWRDLAAKQLPTGLQMLGPEPAFIARVKTKWRFHIMIKAPRSFRGLSSWLRQVRNDFGAVPGGYRVAINVDAIGTF